MNTESLFSRPFADVEEMDHIMIQLWNTLFI